MEFLGIGYQELLLVLILMLVVVGPERLPGMAYQIGRAVRTLQQYARQVRDEFGEEIGYLEEQVRVVRGEVDTLNTELRQQSAQFTNEMREATAPITAELKQLNAPLKIEPASTVPAEAALVTAGVSSANGVSHNGNGSTPPGQALPAASPADVEPQRADEKPKNTLVF